MHNEGSKQCIVPGYTKSKLKDCDNIDVCLSVKPLIAFLDRAISATGKH